MNPIQNLNQTRVHLNRIATDYEKAFFDRFPEKALFWGRSDAVLDRFMDHSLTALATWQKLEDRFLEDLNQLNQDQTSYAQAVSKLPDYTPRNQPNDGQVSTILSDASKQTGQWKTTGQSYQSQVSQYAADADTIATQSIAAHCQA